MGPLATAGLVAAGLLAGAMNAVVGGGSFVTFPALVAAGLPPVIANVSSTVALFPGGLGSIVAYRHDLHRTFAGVGMPALVVTSAAGGLAGAVLLLATPAHAFDAFVPWILLLATLAFAFGRQIGSWIGRLPEAGPATILAIQFVLGIYGGYFGGAVGIMMLAAWSVVTRIDITMMNPHRSLLVNAANALAVLYFVLAGRVAWPATLALLGGTVLGGYLGALWARRLDARVIRAPVIVAGSLVTAAFFARLV